jgi:hypothetical protein
MKVGEADSCKMEIAVAITVKKSPFPPSREEEASCIPIFFLSSTRSSFDKLRTNGSKDISSIVHHALCIRFRLAAKNTPISASPPAAAIIPHSERVGMAGTLLFVNVQDVKP